MFTVILIDANLKLSNFFGTTACTLYISNPTSPHIVAVVVDHQSLDRHSFSNTSGGQIASTPPQTKR
jgi:hypothetical protein